MNWIFSEKITFDSDLLNEKLNVNPWSGHRNFVYDLIVNLKPNTIVELGSHYGCSFFAFAQAIKDKSYDTKLFGIDTWEGEEHAGRYGNEVFELFNKTVNTYYKDQDIKLLRKYFNEAVNEFEDKSIDILHIDGLHTYEATKEDFLLYLPKLKDNGIVLFHDIANYTGYGTSDYWKELKKEFPYSFEFNHSWGLGVLFPKSEENFKKLDFFAKDLYINYYENKAEKELLFIKNKDKKKMIYEKDLYVKELELKYNNLFETIQSQTELIDERDLYIKELELKYNKLFETIQSQTELIDERDLYIKELESKIN